jgi:hypothetical protein
MNINADTKQVLSVSFITAISSWLYIRRIFYEEKLMTESLAEKPRKAV